MFGLRQDGVRLDLVETACLECVIRILAFSGDPDPRENHVDVSVISSHLGREYSSWRGRVRNAWAVLRNRYDWTGFQIESRAQGDAVLDILRRAVDDAWPVQPMTRTPSL